MRKYAFTALRREYAVSAAAAVMAAALPQAAAAQDAEAAAAAPNPAYGEIVVTAQRRDETLQEVPVAITAVPPERLEQLSIRKVDQLEAVTPGLVFNTGYSYTQLFIRGVV